MKLKIFMQENNASAFEVIPDILILNIVVGEVIYGLNVDTSSIQSGTELVRIQEYSLENDILTVGNLSLNTNEVEMLS
jgi:hypothetical protein